MLEQKIREAAEQSEVPVEVYFTKAIRDAENYVRTVCTEKNPGEAVRFYACGGDGTLNEAINGAFGFSDVEVAFVPTGTGNDFARDFGSPELFLDIRNQIAGTSVPVDLIRYSGVLDGTQKTRYCANMINMGFDCNVVHRAAKMKKIPLISGSMAYLLGILVEMIEKNGAWLRVETGGRVLCDGKILLSSVANGSFCGGGLKGSPEAVNSDGLFDVQVIQNVTRRLMLLLLPKYAKGQHVDDPRTAPFLTYLQVDSLKVTPQRRPFRICVDGEMELLDGPMELDILPGAFWFVVPAGL